LRETGGFYFVPRDKAGLWRVFTGVVHAVSRHRVYEIPAMRSDEAVAAILAALESEAAAEAKALEDELCKGEVTARTCTSRLAKCRDLAAKVASYEQLLGANLDVLRERLGHLDAGLAEAALSAVGK
jgi:hypothetical protein